MAFLDVGGATYEDIATAPDLIHMGHNCNYLPLDPGIKQAMIEAIEREEYRNYAPAYGFQQLRDAIRADVGVADVDALITHGSTDAIYQALSVLLRPGDEVIVADPGWPHIPNFARGLDAAVVPVPVYGDNTRYKLLPELVREHLSERTRVIAVIDPLNPLGSGYSEDEIRTLCRIADEQGLYILHDCTYRDFAGGDHYPAVRYTDHAAMAVSLSKSCGFAGLRLGAVLAQPALFREMLDKQVSRLGTNWVVQRGAIAAYASKSRWLPKLLETNARHQALLEQAVDATEGLKVLVYPSKGNFLAVDVTGTGRNSEDIVAAVLDAGVVIRSGSYTSKDYGGRFVRITTTVPTEHVERLCAVLPEVVSKLRV